MANNWRLVFQSLFYCRPVSRCSICVVMKILFLVVFDIISASVILCKFETFTSAVQKVVLSSPQQLIPIVPIDSRVLLVQGKFPEIIPSYQLNPQIKIPYVMTDEVSPKQGGVYSIQFLMFQCFITPTSNFFSFPKVHLRLDALSWQRNEPFFVLNSEILLFCSLSV